MKLQCKLLRVGGSTVTIGNQSYHFKPEENDPNGPHLAEVTNPAHLAAFLSNPEGYEIYGKDANDAAQQGAVSSEIDVNAIWQEGFDAGYKKATDEFEPQLEAMSKSWAENLASAPKSLLETQAAAAQEEIEVPTQQDGETDAEQSSEGAAMSEEELNQEELEASYQLVVQDSDTALDTEIDKAFEYLFGRKPNPAAKRETKIDRIMSEHQNRVAAELGTDQDADEDAD